MRQRTSQSLFLGLECGGTRTVALLADAAGALVKRLEAGPANWRLLGPQGLSRLLKGLAGQFPPPVSIAIGMAGARSADDRAKIRQVLERIWRGVPIHVGHDLETALWAAGGAPDKLPRVIVLSGTGSCCYGQSPTGEAVKLGGWGHILGDKGSGYEIGLRALKAVVFYLDRDGDWTELGRRILRALQLNDPEQLIAWVQGATKDQIAALAIEVFAAAKNRDTIARDILLGAANVLAKDAVACAKRLVKRAGEVEFVFAGSVLLKQPAFAARIRRAIKEHWPKANFKKLNRETAWGAVELARQGRTALPACPSGAPISKSARAARRKPDTSHGSSALQEVASSPTEQRNSRSVNLDRMSVGDAIKLMLSEDAKLPAAIRRESAAIEKLIGHVVRAFRHGGRLFYVGAGTSGRLGVLDASECPPTFRTPPDLVQGIIAGGQTAIWSAVEGAEDDVDAGAQAVAYRTAGRRDVLVGIAASGRTPFVWGALREAKRRGVTTALICFNPHLKIAAKDKPAILICPRIGPEVLTGSTRLKAGTATKLILNLITTIAMVRMGKVISNLMVDLNPSNVKLRDRAVRIAATLTGQPPDLCLAALERTRWDVTRAIQHLGIGR